MSLSINECENLCSYAWDLNHCPFHHFRAIIVVANLQLSLLLSMIDCLTLILKPVLCAVHGLAGHISDLTVASSEYDTLLCSETLVLYMRHVSELLVSGFGRPVLLCRGKLPRTRGMAVYVGLYEMVTDYFANLNLSVVIAKC